MARGNLMVSGNNKLLNKLQRVQNVAAWILTCTKTYKLMTPVLILEVNEKNAEMYSSVDRYIDIEMQTNTTHI